MTRDAARRGPCGTPQRVGLANRSAIGALLAATLSWPLVACRPAPTRVVRVTLPDDVDAQLVRVTPPSAVRERHHRAGALELVVPRDATVTLSSPVTCPVTSAPGTRDDVTLRPIFSLPSDGDLAPVGFGGSALVTARIACDEGRKGSLSWSVEGPATLGATDAMSATVIVASLPDAPLPWGVVPMSPRSRGAATVRARWTSAEGVALERGVVVSAMARATGVPSLAVGQEVLLGGRGWALVQRTPKDAPFALAPVEGRSDVARFRATSAGQFVLMSEGKRPLSIRAGTYDRVPLDCGRSECHARTTAAAQASPMTHVLRNGLEGLLGPGYRAECALACHAVGEPGSADRGFVTLMRELGVTLSAPHAGAWDELPRDLRRLGGVGCTTCHGPAAIPEPTARFAILRSDVCAVCHDAPPRYGHVAEWRTSAMARSDADDGARTRPECARCHSTAGFLRTLSPAPREDAPADARPIGIACAACHAPHGDHTGRLLRVVPVPPEYDAIETRSRICVVCHQNDAARVWLGAPGARSAHDKLGCVGCHMSGAQGANHSFRSGVDVCRSCHGAAVPAAPHREARPARPAHANRDPGGGMGPASLVEAIRDDRAAWVHNPAAYRTVPAR